MARPKLDGTPDAVTRMMEAFWDCLEEKPFAAITVKDIAQHANVNRNTFYYHFEDMIDLARATLNASLVTEFSELAHIFLLNNEKPAELPPHVGSPTQMRKIKLISGKHSTHELIELMKDAALKNAFALSGINEDDVSFEDLISLRFILAGIVDLWGSADERYGKDTLTPLALFSTKIMQSNLNVARSIIEKYTTA